MRARTRLWRDIREAWISTALILGNFVLFALIAMAILAVVLNAGE